VTFRPVAQQRAKFQNTLVEWDAASLFAFIAVGNKADHVPLDPLDPGCGDLKIMGF
jgi:hypothetical protein